MRVVPGVAGPVVLHGPRLRRARAAVPLAVVAVLAAPGVLAPTAAAEVAVVPGAALRSGETTGATVVAPDGTSRRLARHRVASQDDTAEPSLSPDGRYLARRSEQRIVLVPTDGGPVRVLGARGARAQGSGEVWWDADGRHVNADGISGPGDDGSTLRCTVAAGPCEIVPGGGTLLTPTVSGAAIWSAGSQYVDLQVPIGSEYDLLDATDGWVAVSRGDVRRARRVLARPVRTHEELRAPDGRVVRRLWTGRRSARAGVDEVAGVTASPVGTLLTRRRVRQVLRTRRRKGRLQLRLLTRATPDAFWRVDEQGTRTPVRPRSPERDVLESTENAAGTPDGWVLRATSREDEALVALLTPDGTVRRLQVAGGPVTAGRLHAALGRPEDEAPTDVDELFLSVEGYEAATASVVVQFKDAASRTLVVRVPVDATTPPSLVARSAPNRDLQVAVGGG